MSEMEMTNETNSKAGPDITKDMEANEDVSITEDVNLAEDLGLTEDLSTPGDVGTTEDARTSPPDEADNEDPEDWDHQLLLQKFEELRAKYANAKRHYFERDAQVAELQKSLNVERHSVSEVSLGSAQLEFDEDGWWIGYDAGTVDDDIEFGQGEFPSYDIDDTCTSPVRGLATEDDSMREYIDSQMTLRSSAEKQIAQLIEERADLQRQLAEKKLDDLRSEVQARKLMKENGRLRGELLETKRKWVVD